MTDFKKSTDAQGLEIHPGKTKILTTQKSNRLKEIGIDGVHVEILPLEEKEISGTDDHIHESRNYRGAAQDPLCVVRSPDIDRNRHPCLACSDTGYISWTLLTHRQ